MSGLSNKELLRKKFLQVGGLYLKSGGKSNSRKYLFGKKINNNKEKNIFKNFIITSKSIWGVSKLIGGILLIVFIFIYCFKFLSLAYVFLMNYM